MNKIPVVVFILAFFSAMPTRAAIVTLDPAEISVTPNASITLDLVGRDFLVNLDGGSVTISFDPAVLKVVQVEVNRTIWDFESDPPRSVIIDNVAGRIDELEFNTLQNITGNFDIARITFTALSPGVANLVLAGASNPFGSGGDVVDVSFGNGSITVVPVPASIVLLFSALGLVGRFRRRPF
jgi:hypothetical protein